MNLVADLKSRGLFHQASDPDMDARLRALAAKRTDRGVRWVRSDGRLAACRQFRSHSEL